MLYLIRHAEAVYGAEDDGRQLSVTGCDEVRRLAEFLRSGDEMKADEIWHSPLVRARQTAELLAQKLGLRAPLRETDGLRPEDDPAALAPRLRGHLALAIVGHEPFMSSLGSLLVTGSAEPVIRMRKCAILALERIGGGDCGCWAVCWHIAPELLAKK